MSQVVFWGLVALCASVVMTAVVVSAYWRVQGGSILGVQTGSMVPTFAPGDALIIKPIKTNSLKIGDIVSYQSQLQPGIIISHRIVNTDPSSKTITTRGDYLDKPDNPVSMSAVRGKAVMLVPKFGYILSALHHPLGLIVLIYLPAVGVVFYELKRFSKLTAGHYVLAGYMPHSGRR
jgi:signal peptidase